MSKQDTHLDSFKNLVEIRFQLYNSLFLTLPYERLENVGNALPRFSSLCKTEMENGYSPTEVVESFLTELVPDGNLKTKNDSLFRILQLVERQVVLFDALEEVAFDQTNDLSGPGTLDNLLSRVEENDLHEELSALLDDYRIRIVLTAHPTQFYPEAVLGIIADLREAIRKNDTGEIRNLLLQLGQTRFKNKEKPTPFKEAQGVIRYLNNIFYPSFSNLQKKLHKSSHGDDELKRAGLMELGFWPCGDRDGNPFVTHETTLQAASELKSSILKLYLEDSKTLMRRLTFDGVLQDLQGIQERISATLSNCYGKESEQAYANLDEFLDELNMIRDSLVKNHRGLFLDELDHFIRKIRIFGFHFAAMDMRQDSEIHDTAIEEILEKFLAHQEDFSLEKSYLDLSESQKIELLLELTKVDMPEGFQNESFPSELTAETLKSIQTIRQIHKSNGEAGMHRYIISNTQSALHLFQVIALAHFSGWKLEDLNIDIVPLFETIDDLKNSMGIMETLYTHPVYSKHLLKRGNKQHIMLGFSDGTKDGGYLTANWAIYCAKKDLTSISRKFDVNVTFFDGRGGPPARGGGNTHKFYRSLGQNIDHKQIHLTIQGQTISSNFGFNEAAQFNTEQMFTSGIESHIFHGNKDDLNLEQENILHGLAKISKQKYLDFKSHPLFTEYLEEMTPLKYYGRLNIGSRPAKRKKAAKLKLSDLRAIPFVGSWAQIKQNIPGFYGLGSALAPSMVPGKIEPIKKMYKESLFFRTLIENAMQSLSKTYFPLTEYLAKDKKYGGFWTMIHDEARLTLKVLKDLTGQTELLENQPAVKASIEMREKIILPLLTIQQYALEVVRKAEKGEISLDEAQVELFRKMVVKSLAANINASRNAA
jgi:phosphoenolpyruvate carboxylase